MNYGSIINTASRSDNINQSGLVLDMEAKTKKLDPDSYLFLALVREINSDLECKRMKHSYRERRLIPNFTTVSVAGAAGDTDIDLLDYNRTHNDHLLYVPRTGDLLLVQAEPTSAAVTIVNATTGTGGLTSAVVVGDKVVLMGEAHAEGEAIPNPFSNDSIDVDDYIQQTDRVVQATDIEEAEEHYDDEEKLAEDRRAAFIEYQRDRNVLFYVGKNTREIVSASGRRRHIMGGVFEKFNENIIDCSAQGQAFTLTTLGNILSATKYHGASSMNKIGLFGTNGWAAISSWGLDKLRITAETKKFGLRLRTVITAFGDVDCSYDPVLNEEKGLQDRAIVFDAPKLRSLYLRGKKVRMFLDITNSEDIHNRKDAISGTFGLKAEFPELHAQVEGIGE